MPRSVRIAPGGLVYHVINRGVGQMTLFDTAGDYAAFVRCLRRAQDARPMRLLSYCVMPNHWHLVLWPRYDGDLGAFMQRLTVTHARRWQEHRQRHGTGHVYQGRYKSFPIEQDEHLLAVLRYVERNAMRANLVKRAEDWPWCALSHRRRGAAVDVADAPQLADWPINEPRHWLRTVNEVGQDVQLDALRLCVNRGRPYGSDRWVKRQTKALGLASTFRPRGRPRKDGGE